ncbi:MAG: dipeptide epimerase [Trichodesmium sp. MAG_R01]|nr:dipeptide epimerase [Trichodesmium sp. MAG_R01]
MANIHFETIFLKKKFPLRISRGTCIGSENLFVYITRNEKVGIGEMCPGLTEGAETAKDGKAQIEKYLEETGSISSSVIENYEKAIEYNLAPCALAALDIALWDLLAKEANMPLFKVFGLNLPSVSTSITLGIMPLDEIEERIFYLRKKNMLKNLKIKLGSPEGIDKDKEMLARILHFTKKDCHNLRVDANGGWSLDDAHKMLKWLYKKEYVEQPLAKGQEEDLKFLFKDRPLPIFVDESCRNSKDILPLSNYVDGINLKLMKCGGLSEAIKMISIARNLNLKTMIGCMGESSVSISAACSIGALFDYIDLDSHLNLDPDPTSCADFVDGIVTPLNRLGHGAFFTNA